MNRKIITIVGIIVILVVVALASNVWLGQQRDGDNDASPTPTPTTSPTPSPATSPTAEPTVSNEVTKVNVYLVAVGDTNPQFKQIGCGDGLVPVERQISPTRAPLGAAYRELLGLTEADTEASGLYDALRNSDLAYARASVEDGLARVYLTGQLQLGGECDNPRVKAQLEDIALQFATVDRVEVFINDRPLDEVLSLKGE